MADLNHLRLKSTADIVRRGACSSVSRTDALAAGVDLGTADVVFLVLNAAGEPVCGYLEWAEVVRDGVVIDFVGARRILRSMLDRAQDALGREIRTCSTGYPPGTDPNLSTNVVEDAGLEVAAVLDEPTAAARALQISDGVVVDIGGGTTGISVLQKGAVVYSADEATGGRHLSLVIAGAFKIPYEEAEQKKRSAQGGETLNAVRPVIEKMASIVESHIRGADAGLPIVLVGGTAQLPGFPEIFSESLGRPVQVPPEPLFATPVGIALAGLPAATVPKSSSRVQRRRVIRARAG